MEKIFLLSIINFPEGLILDQLVEPLVVYGILIDSGSIYIRHRTDREVNLMLVIMKIKSLHVKD